MLRFGIRKEDSVKDVLDGYSINLILDDTNTQKMDLGWIGGVLPYAENMHGALKPPTGRGNLKKLGQG